MNQDKVIELAREAGFVVRSSGSKSLSNIDDLTAFAALVAARAAAAAELRRLHAVNQELVEALQSISEYWNGDRNDTAMHDACEYAITVAQAALANAQGEGK